MSSPTKCAVLVVAIVAAANLTASSQAAITVTDWNTTGYTVSASDLLQTNLASMTSVGNFQSGEGAVGVSALTDGSFGALGSNDWNATPEAALAGNGNSVTYVLNTTTNTRGYNISQINTYSGWSWARYAQAYSVSVHEVGADANNFVTLATVSYAPTTGGSGDNYMTVNTKVSISSSDGLLASNVDAIQFTFNNSEDWLTSYVGYREIDVIGNAVPEPTALVMILCGGISLLVYAWRKRR